MPYDGIPIGLLNTQYLRLDCANDPLVAGLQINAATAVEPTLILRSTDDNATNPYLDLQITAVAQPYLMKVAGSQFLHTYGTNNLFLGVGAGNFTLTDRENLGVGGLVLPDLTTGYMNTCIGYRSGRYMDTGHHNVFVGGETGLSGTSLNWCIFVGYRVGFSATTSYGSTIIGANSGVNLTTADKMVFYGFEAGKYNTTGDENSNFGNSAGRDCTIGTRNTNVGAYAGTKNVTSHFNTMVGYAAGINNTEAAGTLIGDAAGYSQTSGKRNTIVGREGNYYNQTGAENVCVGWRAGYGTALHNKSGCVLIGAQAGFNDHNSNRLYIANSSTTTPLIYGEFDTFRLAIGNQYKVDKYGQRTHASGMFAAVGDAQGSAFICRRAIAMHVDTTWYALYPDGGTTPARLTIAADTAWTVHALVIGITQSAGAQWGYEIIGLIERDNANNTTLAGQTLRTIFESDAAYEAQLAADDVNEALEVQVRRNGGADNDIRWVASVRLAQVTYPT